jgi:hypothetical protein
MKICLYFQLINICLTGILSKELPNQTNNSSISNKERLIGDLLNSYNKTMREQDTTDPVMADAKLTNFSIVHVDELKKKAKFKLSVQIEWKNKYLQWDPSNYSGLAKFESNDILIPELSLIHFKDDVYKLNATKLKRAKIELHANGFNFVKISLVFDTIWDSDIYYFPFDRKTCVMKFDSSSKLFQDVCNFDY